MAINAQQISMQICQAQLHHFVSIGFLLLCASLWTSATYCMTMVTVSTLEIFFTVLHVLKPVAEFWGAAKCTLHWYVDCVIQCYMHIQFRSDWRNSMPGSTTAVLCVLRSIRWFTASSRSKQKKENASQEENIRKADVNRENYDLQSVCWEYSVPHVSFTAFCP